MNNKPDNEKRTGFMTLHEIQAARIKDWRCPLCGSPVWDKETSVQCSMCTFAITNGIWDTENGWCMERKA